MVSKNEEEVYNKILHTEFRYERKFLISELSSYDVDGVVKMHPFMFSEAFPAREVNNLYFDTEDLHNYYDNIEGRKNRIKVRVRWYGELFGNIEHPILELKVKNGLLGKKISVEIPPFSIDRNQNIGGILNPLNNMSEKLMVDFNLLRPTLMNKYTRWYYQSCNKKYRVTIDSNQHYYYVQNEHNTFSNHIVDTKNVILELKYNQVGDDNVSMVSSVFPFRVSKSSKYVTGVEKVMARL